MFQDITWYLGGFTDTRATTYANKFRADKLTSLCSHIENSFKLILIKLYLKNNIKWFSYLEILLSIKNAGSFFYNNFSKKVINFFNLFKINSNKMAKLFSISNGLKELRSYLNNIDSKKSVFILFTGDKTEANGKSWCSDCNGKCYI